MLRWIALLVAVSLLVACNGMETPMAPDETPGTPRPPTPVAAVTPGIDPWVRDRVNQTGGGYFLLQFTRSLDPGKRAQLVASGIALYDYVPDHAYYAFLPGSALPVLEEMFEDGLLRHAGPIPVEAKVEPALSAKAEADPGQELELVVLFFEELEAGDKQELERYLAARDYSFGPVDLAEGTARAADVDSIASLPFVKWVEERVPMELGTTP